MHHLSVSYMMKFSTNQRSKYDQFSIIHLVETAPNFMRLAESFREGSPYNVSN